MRQQPEGAGCLIGAIAGLLIWLVLWFLWELIRRSAGA